MKDSISENSKAITVLYHIREEYRPLTIGWKALSYAIRVLKEAEKQKHGRWVESEIPHEKFKCSQCSGACWYYDYKGDVARSRYCPNCGAKMDEVEV